MTDWQRERFGKEKRLFIDGNFKLKPEGFKQLIFVMACHETQFGYPLMFVLVNTKAQEAYVEIFREIRMCLEDNDCNPSEFSLTMDFERGLQNAAEQELRGIRIVGCGFHFMQRLKKKLHVSAFLDDSAWQGFKRIVYEFLNDSLDFNQMMDRILVYLSATIKLRSSKIEKIEGYMKSAWKSRARFLTGNKTRDHCSWTNNYCESFNNKLNTMGNRSEKLKIFKVAKGLFEITEDFLNKLMSSEHIGNPTASAYRSKKRRSNSFRPEPLTLSARSQPKTPRRTPKKKKIQSEEQEFEQKLKTAQINSLQSAIRESEKKHMELLKDQNKKLLNQMSKNMHLNNIIEKKPKEEVLKYMKSSEWGLVQNEKMKILGHSGRLSQKETEIRELKKQLEDLKKEDNKENQMNFNEQRIFDQSLSSIEKKELEEKFFSKSESENNEVMVINDELSEQESEIEEVKKRKTTKKKKAPVTSNRRGSKTRRGRGSKNRRGRGSNRKRW